MVRKHKMSINLTKEQIDNGSEILSDLFEASVSISADYSKFANPYLVQKYMCGEVCAVEAMYIVVFGKPPISKQIEKGNQCSSELQNASIRSAMGGLGGCKEFDINDFTHKELVQAYIDGDKCSVECISIAMESDAE